MWLLVDPEDRGPGTSFRQVLFNPTFTDGNSLVMNLDLDQYTVNTADALCQIAELAERVEKETALYATGSRDVPVILASNQRNNELRIIHELFHSLTIGSDNLAVREVPPNITPAYAQIGESTSGFYVVNFAHARFPELTQDLVGATQVADMRGFATDYFVAIRSAQLGKLSKGYVKSTKNKFHEKKDKEKEFSGVMRLILGQTAELGKTGLKNDLLTSLTLEGNTERLSEFYSREDVELVRDTMKTALTE